MTRYYAVGVVVECVVALITGMVGVWLLLVPATSPAWVSRVIGVAFLGAAAFALWAAWDIAHMED